ncbi:MAG: O-methyltransferase [Saprospiraceae bacterium]
MQNIQLDSTVQSVISLLFKDAKFDGLRAAKGMAKMIFRPLQPKDMENVYLPVSQEQGEFFYKTIVNNQFQSIVEFGTSFGISTLFLAAAAKETGGKVITTELLSSKAKTAKNNFEKADLENFIELREGDAMKTLANFNQPIDFLMLDGWKNLYLPLFKQLEPFFHKKTIIYADNVDMADSQPLLDYVYANSNIYKSRRVHQGKGELIICL